MKERGAPVFVKVDEYKDILDTLDMIRDKVREIKETLGEIDGLREEEGSELSMWRNVISDIEKKVENIDRVMYEPEQL
ncbi:MAG TPA: hypothetical protein VJI97_04110 [Candidatus Nanoarchaeia archaeon]|nr:hypothetical protein [Candidatus Nanoarchaeia archaeon]